MSGYPFCAEINGNQILHVSTSWISTNYSICPFHAQRKMGFCTVSLKIRFRIILLIPEGQFIPVSQSLLKFCITAPNTTYIVCVYSSSTQWLSVATVRDLSHNMDFNRQENLHLLLRHPVSYEFESYLFSLK